MFDACQVHYQGKPHFAGILLCGQHPDLLLQGELVTWLQLYEEAKIYCIF